MASFSGYYGDQHTTTPFTNHELYNKSNVFPKEIEEKLYQYDEFGDPIGSMEDEDCLGGCYLNVLEIVGKKIMIDKIIEPFTVSPLSIFHKHQITVENFQLLQKALLKDQSERNSAECEPSMTPSIV
jgi:hypothetical protein